MFSSSFGTKFHLYMLAIPKFISEVQLLTKSRLNFLFIISTWIANQYLKFNMPKTELLVYLQSLFSPHIYLSQLMEILASSFHLFRSKYLGVILDSSFIHSLTFITSLTFNFKMCPGSNTFHHLLLLPPWSSFPRLRKPPNLINCSESIFLIKVSILKGSDENCIYVWTKFK